MARLGVRQTVVHCGLGAGSGHSVQQHGADPARLHTGDGGCEKYRADPPLGIGLIYPDPRSADAAARHRRCGHGVDPPCLV